MYHLDALIPNKATKRIASGGSCCCYLTHLARHWRNMEAVECSRCSLLPNFKFVHDILKIFSLFKTSSIYRRLTAYSLVREGKDPASQSDLTYLNIEPVSSTLRRLSLSQFCKLALVRSTSRTVTFSTF